MNEIRYIDLFAGVGGFRVGLEKANERYKCVWSNEWDKYASSIYKKHYGECDTRDIRTVKSGEIPDFDLLAGGFPCQAFSVAGKRKGFQDTRGTMFFEIARILADKRPRYFLLENVKGLLSHESGKTFQTILGILTDLGYEFEWQVLNSKNFGVPQNRERVFIIGHLGNQPRPEVFPIGQGGGISDQTGEGESGSGEGIRGEISSRIDSRYGALRNAGETYMIHNVYGGFKEGIREFENYSPTIRTPKGGGHLPMVVERTPLKFLDRNQKNIEGDYSFTVDGANTGGIKQGTKIRRLTPTECARLQGFDDNWCEGLSDTQAYKCYGNAVTTNVVEFIGRRLLDCL